ncbi:MAG: Gfo/Idh/MocA family oxidoreductase [Actinomycetia bacterium]|nr:Gfo/Idh/MocA family oxidoreductase [Actinomycetes bacterium]
MTQASDSEPTRVAIVGHGAIAEIHAQAVRAIPHAMLVGVAGRNLKRTRSFAMQHSAEAFTDTETMVHSTRADIVIVATPHPTHADIAIAAAAAKAHILVEKPLAVTTADCDRMIDAAASAGVTLGVVGQRRLLPAVVRMKSAIADGAIGKPILGSVTLLGWRDPDYYDSAGWRGTWQGEGGGVLVNQAVHHLDLLQWLMGPFDEVFGYWANLNHPTIDVDDTAVAVLRGADGRLASIVVSNSQHPGLHARVLIHGDNGASVGVQTDGGSMFVAGSTEMLEAPYNHIWTVPGDEHLLATWREKDEVSFSERDPIVHSIEMVIRDFITATRSGEPPAVSGHDGRGTVEIFEAIYRSTDERKPFPLSSAS